MCFFYDDRDEVSIYLSHTRTQHSKLVEARRTCAYMPGSVHQVREYGLQLSSCCWVRYFRCQVPVPDIPFFHHGGHERRGNRHHNLTTTAITNTTITTTAISATNHNDLTVTTTAITTATITTTTAYIYVYIWYNQQLQLYHNNLSLKQPQSQPQPQQQQRPTSSWFLFITFSMLWLTNSSLVRERQRDCC